VTVCCSPAPAVPITAPRKNVVVAITQVRRHHGGLSDGGFGGGGAPQLLGGWRGGGPQPGWVGWSAMSPLVQLAGSGRYHTLDRPMLVSDSITLVPDAAARRRRERLWTQRRSCDAVV
jgi:hypothetical protein